MKRLSCTLLALALAASQPTAPAAEAAKLNVLLMVADDLRDTLGCYGNTQVRTPNIDRLAARGVRFERAYVQYPVCNPSRSSFLTGLRPDQTGVTDNNTILRDKVPDVVTWPQLLKDHGWHTAALGKIFHLGGGRDARQRERYVDLPKSWHSAEDFTVTPAGRERIAGRNVTGGTLKWCKWASAAGTDDDQPDGQIARAVIEKIDSLGAKPWMIGAGFMKPHDPFIAPQKYFALYPPGSIKLHRDPKDQTPAPPLAVGFGEYGKAFGKFTDEERMELHRAYLACTSFMDAQVGRVLDELDRRKLWDTTVVIFIGDHGYHLGERDWWNKNTVFERSCRTPLIVAAPGIKPGVARGLVEFVDLFPTVADLCGVKAPSALTGQSLRPLLEDPSKAGKSAAYTIVTRGPMQRGDSIRTERWRYTEWSDGTRELYDHTVDPEETKNLAESPAGIAAIGEITPQLHQFKTTTSKP